MHPELLLYIQDLDADHRVSHDIFKNVKVSVLYDGAGDCIVWYEFVGIMMTAIHCKWI